MTKRIRHSIRCNNPWKILRGELGIEVAKVIEDHPILVDLIRYYLSDGDETTELKSVILKIITDYDDALNKGNKKPYPERLYHDLCQLFSGVILPTSIPAYPPYLNGPAISTPMVNSELLPKTFQVNFSMEEKRVITDLHRAELARTKRALKGKLTEKGEELMTERQAIILSALIELEKKAPK